MGRHSELITFIGEMASRFGGFHVVGLNEKSEDRSLQITDVIADDSDGEICIVGDENASSKLALSSFYSRLEREVGLHPEYSLMVSQWFEIDPEHTGRADSPLKSIEVDEVGQELRLIY
jgi:hypothetical protein